MPSFANPFAGNVDRKMTNEELMQALRLDIAGELEAIYLYESHYLATDNPVREGRPVGHPRRGKGPHGRTRHAHALS